MEIFQNLMKMFSEFSIMFRQTVGDLYLNKYTKILGLHFSKKYCENMLRFNNYCIEVQYDLGQTSN